ncbi:sarcalumenin-like isoform X1 [Homalodisca vitripennis]|uniref:sarcalumenin-like isoform X1 n=1 Tax=Homalodisca vitripennis TaxID=197043 RepID=UPI001EEC46EB|nr:sarcalumenin-like isoform X1 [Homalodisca vitripennis]
MDSVDAPFKYLVKMFETGDVGEAVSSNQTIDISLHERLFRQLSELYNHPKNGLITIGQKINLDILPPKKKVTILLVGNHSAGKSSFINWYIEENVQRTGMAIETQSFTVVASGKKRETLMGPATVFLFPHLKPLEKIQGIMDNLNAEISTSKKRQFSMLTFIDTPGLVDGSMEYPYNVNDAILFLGGVSDLIFVFFDPIGLALCKRTMLVVEKINSLYPEKLRFYLSKSDEIRRQTDKQKVMMQITQEVCRHSGLNRSGFTMPGIYIPTLARTPLMQKQPSSTSGNLEKNWKLPNWRIPQRDRGSLQAD